MRRALAILLLLLLPLQAAFAAAAGYCDHARESSQAGHFGHHPHQHDVSLDQGGSTGSDIDPDCGFCHLSLLKAMHGADRDAQPVTAASPDTMFAESFRSIFPPTPHRPPLASVA